MVFSAKARIFVGLACVMNLAAAAKLEVYSAPGCTYCNQLKDRIKELGMEYTTLPLGKDDEWGAMQQRVMGCCSDAVHEIGKPQDLLILMPQLMIDGKWAGSNRSPQLSQLLEASLKKAAYKPTDATANHMEMAYDKLDDEDHEGAIEAFRAATKFAPTKFGSSTWFNLGIALTDAEARGDKAASAEARKEAARAFQQLVYHAWETIACPKHLPVHGGTIQAEVLVDTPGTGLCHHPSYNGKQRWQWWKRWRWRR